MGGNEGTEGRVGRKMTRKVSTFTKDSAVPAARELQGVRTLPLGGEWKDKQDKIRGQNGVQSDIPGGKKSES